MEDSNIIESIFEEEVIIQDDCFHIVRDKDPICRDHLLVFPKKHSDALLNCSTDSLSELLKKLRIYYSSEFYYFERGNVSFCTTFNGPIYAHLHVVPQDVFSNDLIFSLSKEMGDNVRRYSKIEDIYQSSITMPQEYLLFGKSDGNIYIKYPFIDHPKRFIRNFLQKNKNK